MADPLIIIGFILILLFYSQTIFGLETSINITKAFAQTDYHHLLAAAAKAVMVCMVAGMWWYGGGMV